QYMITDYKTNRKNDAEPLQLIVYEKMLKEKHGEANKVASQFDYILQEKTSKLSDIKAEERLENVTSFLTSIKHFSESWDDVTFDESKSPCTYCEFQSLCRIREGEKND